ncbi:histidine kinase [Adhaeribacter arboris]|uniref:histidine kinase n=1 Tax=Adhaeribacter arboris TaxID=2072846 RepID=A0A2T2YF10_9BACT|nr:GAF domain-containing sensor histidine kinase [Adhaeribacter arboris]PSR54073.1 histidine kinase [Adhaeribacter arboris]
MISSNNNLLQDLEAIQNISFVPNMLEFICQVTGMGFAAVARVTPNKWIACSVRDEVQFGLKAGEELPITSTLCNEIQDHRRPIIIDNVALDSAYKHHHTPQIYGLQSYISFPIILKNGTFFGTLCAIHSKPAALNNQKVVDTFTMFAEMLSFHLQSQDLLERSYCATVELQNKNTVLTKANNDLDSIVYTAAHDLKSPITNIESLVEVLSYSMEQENLNRAEINQIIGLMKSSLKSFYTTIQDLTTIIEADTSKEQETAEEIPLLELVETVKWDLQQLIDESQAKIEVNAAENVMLHYPRKYFRSILYNLLNNALKYRSPVRTPVVLVALLQVEGKIHFSVTDNGLGIAEDQQDKVFTLFKRFHNHVEGSGLGLYIVKKMVEYGNGQIQVNSTLDQGTTITVIF